MTFAVYTKQYPLHIRWQSWDTPKTSISFVWISWFRVFAYCSADYSDFSNGCLMFVYTLALINRFTYKIQLNVIIYAWWRHQMETFSTLLAICAGNSPVTGEFLAQRPVTRSFDVFFDLHLNKGWVNNRVAGDLRRHRAHYSVIVMTNLRTYVWQVASEKNSANSLCA